jgi:hypothetical protein
MKLRIPEALSDLKDSLELIGAEGLIPIVEAIECAYNEERKQKPTKLVAKKPTTEGLTLVITNANKEAEIYFASEAKAKAWMKSFCKNKTKQVEAYMKAKGLCFPRSLYGPEGEEKYREDSEQHKERLKAAGLDTQILIKRVC